MHAKAVPVTLLLTAAVVLAGCASADTLVVATVPDGELEPGWDFQQDESTVEEVQVGPITVAAFATQVFRHEDAPRGIMAVVTVSDVPLAGVEDRIRDQFRQRLDDDGVQRTERDTGTLQVDGATTEYTLYDAQIERQGARAEGLSIEYTYSCPDESTVVGFLGIARTEIQTSFGSSTDFSSWEEVAGSDWESQIAGMATSVECGG